MSEQNQVSQADPINDTSRLCIHTITTKPWDLETAVNNYAKTGVKGITVWRDSLGKQSPQEAGELIRSNGLEIVSYCRGGFFPNQQAEKRKEAIENNLSCIGEASELGAPMVVLVCGADPGQSLEISRRQIKEGIEAILPKAEACGVKLAIEPLHPMYADDRSAVNTMEQANDLAESINSSLVGVAVDVYHLWWDPALKKQIYRCGKNGNLFAFHICDWKTPTENLLLDRGLMGEGCINTRQIRSWVEKAGFQGYNEVEIFSKKYWESDQKDFLQQILKAYREHA